MYINVNNLLKLKNPLMLPLLLVLKQAAKKDMTEAISQLSGFGEDLLNLKQNGYIKYIKGNKKDSLISKMRLDKKGVEFLNSLDEADVEPQDTQIFEWLSDIYKKKDKQIGNGKKTQRLIAAFRENSGIEKNHLALLCNTFINDDEEQEWSFKLEFVFWKPTNVFQTKFVLEDSRLYKYYVKRREFFDKQFKEVDNETK